MRASLDSIKNRSSCRFTGLDLIFRHREQNSTWHFAVGPIASIAYHLCDLSRICILQVYLRDGENGGAKGRNIGFLIAHVKYPAAVASEFRHSIDTRNRRRAEIDSSMEGKESNIRCATRRTQARTGPGIPPSSFPQTVGNAFTASPDRARGKIGIAKSNPRVRLDGHPRDDRSLNARERTNRGSKDLLSGAQSVCYNH